MNAINKRKLEFINLIRNLPRVGIAPTSSAPQADALTIELPGHVTTLLSNLGLALQGNQFHK
jgi:hypothetical protein